MMFEDDVVYLRRWQKMSQICWTLQELRYFTIELMVLLDYRLNVQEEELDALWTFVLGPFFDNSLDSSGVERFLEFEGGILNS